MPVPGYNLKNDRIISVHFQGKPHILYITTVFVKVFLELVPLSALRQALMKGDNLGHFVVSYFK